MIWLFEEFYRQMKALFFISVSLTLMFPIILCVFEVCRRRKKIIFGFLWKEKWKFGMDYRRMVIYSRTIIIILMIILRAASMYVRSRRRQFKSEEPSRIWLNFQTKLKKFFSWLWLHWLHNPIVYIMLHLTFLFGNQTIGF